MKIVIKEVDGETVVDRIRQCPVVPRIGEEVYFEKAYYRVTNVLYDYSDRLATVPSVRVFVLRLHQD